MKARRLKDNEIVDVIRYEKPINRDEVYVDGKLRLYLPCDLDFDVEEAEQTESAVISGWVARNREPCHGYDLHLFTSKPWRRQIMGDWYGLGETKLDTKLFPSLTWESEPLEVEITLKPKKK